MTGQHILLALVLLSGWAVTWTGHGGLRGFSESLFFALLGTAITFYGFLRLPDPAFGWVLDMHRLQTDQFETVLALWVWAFVLPYVILLGIRAMRQRGR